LGKKKKGTRGFTSPSRKKKKGNLLHGITMKEKEDGMSEIPCVGGKRRKKGGSLCPRQGLKKKRAGQHRIANLKKKKENRAGCEGTELDVIGESRKNSTSVGGKEKGGKKERFHSLHPRAKRKPTQKKTPPPFL